jgi:glycosyltransferase involved in cell wall biosynthesis
VETLRFLMVTSFYPPHHLGGDAVHVQYLAESLASRGHEVHVEYSPASYGAKRPLDASSATTTASPVQVHPISGTSKLSIPAAAYLLGDSRTVDRFHGRLVRDIKPDVLHLHNISLLGLGVQGTDNGQPVLYTAHDYWFRCPRSDLLKNGQAPCEVPTCYTCMIRSRRFPPPWRPTDVGSRLDRIRCVIAPSAFMQRKAEGSFGCPVVHIPHFVPDANPLGRVDPPSSFYLYAGVFEKHKGVRELGQAALEYRGERRFRFVGRGSQESYLRSLSRVAGSHVDVRSWASPEELREMYRNAAALFVPSVSNEISSLSAIEALSWGVPLLSTVRGGVPELLHDGIAGDSFEPTPAGILQALSRFENRPESTRLRRAARTAYETYHRPETYLARYLDVVRKAILHEPPTSHSIEENAIVPEVVESDGRHDH